MKLLNLKKLSKIGKELLIIVGLKNNFLSNQIYLPYNGGCDYCQV